MRSRGMLFHAACLLAAASVAACGSSTTPTAAGGSSPAETSPGTATSTPAPSSPAGPRLSPLPAELRYLWVREPHEIPGLEPATNAAAIDLTGPVLVFHGRVEHGQALSEMFTSGDGVAPDGSVEVILRDDEEGCQAGDQGSYRFAPAAGGLLLHVEVVGEACAPRTTALTGDWFRSACPNHGQWCLGELAAGQHASVNYMPFVPFSEWTFNYGRFGYTVPAGWSNPEDTEDGYFLRPQDAPEGAGLWIFSDVLAHGQTKDCASKPDASVGTSAAAIYEWIRSLPGLKVANVSKHASVGGLEGYSLDLGVDARHAGTCPFNPGHPGVTLFVNAQSTPEEGFDWGIADEARMHLFILELGPTSTQPKRALVIDIEAQDEATWDALVPEALPIVDSFEFRH